MRYRHLDSDFIRTARQQAFVREFKRRLDVWSAGTNLFGLLDSLPNDLKVRGSAKGQSVGPKTILRYLKLLAQIPRGNMVQVRLVGRPAMSTAPPSWRRPPRRSATAVTEFQNPNPAVSQAVASRFGGTVEGGAKKTAKKAPGPKPIAPAKLRVVTVNGSGVQGVATEAKVELQKAGWPHTGVGGHAARGRTSSRGRLLHEPAGPSLGRAAAAVAGRHHCLRRLPAALSDYGLGADVVVAIGKAFSGVTPPPERRPSRPRRRPRPARAGCRRRTTGRLLLLQKRIGYQLLYPTRVPLGSSYGEAVETGDNAYRVYRLGKHGKALSVDARTAFDSSHAWGLRYTTWIDAPILEQPTPAGLLGRKRQVRLYSNGAAIHRIAVFYGGERCKAAGGVVVWIDNSLDDKLSPETMIAIAKSLKPARRAPA